MSCQKPSNGGRTLIPTDLRTQGRRLTSFTQSRPTKHPWDTQAKNSAATLSYHFTITYIPCPEWVGTHISHPPTVPPRYANAAVLCSPGTIVSADKRHFWKRNSRPQSREHVRNCTRCLDYRCLIQISTPSNLRVNPCWSKGVSNSHSTTVCPPVQPPRLDRRDYVGQCRLVQTEFQICPSRPVSSILQVLD